MAIALRVFASALTWLCVFLWMLSLAYSVNLMVDDFLQCREFVRDTPGPPPPTARLHVDTLAARLGLSAPRPPRAESPPLIRGRGPSQYDVSRELLRGFEVALTCANSFLRVTPTYKAGVFRGFQVSFPRSDSFYERLGLRDQDILLGVNGRPLDESDFTSELLTLLRAPPPRIELDVELERDGKRLRRTYRVR